MRDTLKTLMSETFAFKVKLPNEKQCKSCITTSNDMCYEKPDDKKLSSVIYNGIIDLAFEESNINIEDLSNLQKIALHNRINYRDDDEETTKIKYGFYGETILNLFLQYFYGADVIVARGQFYSLLNDTEPFGYDSHHYIYRDNRIELWFAEVKFYSKYKQALNKLFANMQKAISMDYLDKNMLEIINKNIATTNVYINDWINKKKEKPVYSLKNAIISDNMKLVYPIMLLVDEVIDYDNTLKNIIDYIKEKNDEIMLKVFNDIEVEIFFILIPVNNAKKIKKEVIDWISTNKPLI